MALINQINWPRFDSLLKRLFSVHDRTACPSLATEILPVAPVLDVCQPENRFLRGEKLIWGCNASAASVNPGTPQLAVGFANPENSGVVTVIEGVDVYLPPDPSPIAGPIFSQMKHMAIAISSPFAAPFPSAWPAGWINTNAVHWRDGRGPRSLGGNDGLATEWIQFPATASLPTILPGVSATMFTGWAYREKYFAPPAGAVVFPGRTLHFRMPVVLTPGAVCCIFDANSTAWDNTDFFYASFYGWERQLGDAELIRLGA